jgi:hypothetical protein
MPPSEFEFPTEWDTAERDIYESLLGGESEIMSDSRLMMDFHESLFDLDLDKDLRSQFQADLEDYLWDQYGIDFDMEFPWDDYREWYDSL